MSAFTPFNIVLVEPEIPPNTGTTARLCGATDSVLWKNLHDFLAAQDERKLYFFTKKTGEPYTSARYRPGDFLVFGKETKGLPEDVIRMYKDRCYTIPMSNRKIRSLNLANAAGIVLYEALRQQSIW
jgi:tRNA (cytidine/uridine-2'-O-)-methyltransferase